MQKAIEIILLVLKKLNSKTLVTRSATIYLISTTLSQKGELKHHWFFKQPSKTLEQEHKTPWQH